MRLFYAAFLGSETARFYARLVDDVVDSVPETLRPIPPRSAHLTLAFLGDVPEEQLDLCLEALALEPVPTVVSISLQAPRILYGRGAPRLVLADVARGAEKILSIQNELRTRLAEKFPEKLVRPRRPHATLARFRKGLRREAGRRVEAALRSSPAGGTTRDDTIVGVSLVMSTLTPSGAAYEVLKDQRFSDRKL